MAKKGIIVILTDFGLQDPFVGVMKGVIKNINPDVEIIDLSHQIQPQSIRQAAYYLYISYKYFPKGTIFVTVVDPGVGTKREILLCKTEDYYFLGPNNGVLSYVVSVRDVFVTVNGQKFKLRSSKDLIIKVDNESYFLKPVSQTFHGRDIFSPVAAHLSLNDSPYLFGKEFDGELITIPLPRCEIKNEKIYGEVVYCDRFGNLITSIPKDTLKEYLKDGMPVINLKGIKIYNIENNYQSSEFGKPFGIFGSFGYLEISVRNASAKDLLNATEGEEVVIEKCIKE